MEYNPDTVVAIIPSVSTITDAQVGTDTFTLTIDFNESMDLTVDPTVTFPTVGKDPTAVGNTVATLSNPSGQWTDNNTFVVTFDVADDDIVISDIDVRVSGAQDAAGNTMTADTQNDIFSVVTAPPPFIQSISSSSGNGTFGVGDAVNVTVTFDEPVDFTANGGTLQATLSNGETVTLANSDTIQTPFSGAYVIQEGETDSPNLDVTAVSLTGGATLAAAADGVPADLGLPVGQNLADTQDIVVDANTPVAPQPDLSAASDSGSSNTDDLTNVAIATIVGSTEAGATVAVRVGGAGVGTTTADGTGAWSFSFAPGDLSEGANTVDIIASDAVNTSADSPDLTITLDTSPPSLSAADLVAATDTGVSATDDITGDTTPTIEFTAQNSATVAVDWADGGGFVSAAAGTGAAQQETLGSAYASDGIKSITVRATDAAGNDATASILVTVDTTAPALSSFSRQAPADAATNADTLTFLAVFDEDVVDLDAGDFAVTGTTAGVTGVTVVTADTAFGVSVSGGDLAGLNGPVGLNVAGSLTVADLAGNALPAAEPATDEIYAVDNTAPTVTVTTTETDPTNASPIPVTITFGEEVTGFAIGDISVGNGTAGNFATSDNITFTADITPSADGAVTVDVAATAAQDLAGNDNTAAAQLSLDYDATAPTVTVDSLVTTDSTPPLTGTVDDDDAMIEVTVDGQTAPATNNGDGTWTLADDTLSALADGTYDVAVTATDPAGNEGGDSTTDELTITPDTDGDGVDDAVEDAGPNGGDANGDSIPDADQIGVASLPTTTGRGYMSLIVGGACTELAQVAAVTPASLPADPAGNPYPFGLVEFRLPCETATVDVTYHDAAASDFVTSTYRKYGPVVPGDAGTTEWYDFSDFATLAGNAWTLDLADDRLGDDTGDDGVIVDQGGPASGPALPIPINNRWVLLLMACLLLAAGLSRTAARASVARHGGE